MVSRNERFPGNVRVRLRVAADRGESAGGCSGSLASLLLVFFLPEDGVAFVVYFLGEVEVTMTFRGLANDVRRARIDLAFELLHAPVLPVEPDPHLVGRHKELSYRSEEHTSELQSQSNLVCRLLLEKKKQQTNT